ncbi:MAG: hypothetical protein HC901_02450 [Bdellovibrionaceae bacterium]|nr:hypothetical protein [Pseudobdellovibrionaceae bacterium]
MTMDRTSWIALITCMLLLVAYQPVMRHLYPPVPVPAEVAEPEAPGVLPGIKEAPQISSGGVGALTRELPEAARTHVLENGVMAVQVTEGGGGISKIEFKEHLLEEQKRVELNQAAEVPVFNVRGWALPADVAAYTLAERGERRAVLQRTLEEGLRLERIYELGGDHVVTLRQTVYNDTDGVKVMPSCRMDAGTIGTDYQKADERRFLGVSWRTTGGGFHKEKITSFDAGFSGCFRPSTSCGAGPRRSWNGWR